MKEILSWGGDVKAFTAKLILTADTYIVNQCLFFLVENKDKIEVQSQLYFFYYLPV